MNLSSTTREFGRAAESAHENLAALIFWDAPSRWFEPGGLRDSLAAQESVTVLLFLLTFWVLLVVSAAILVCIGIKREAHAARWQVAPQDTPLARIMATDFRSLSATDLLGDAVANVFKSLQQTFPVVDGQNAAGVHSRSELLASLELHAPETALAEILRRNLGEASPAETLGTASRRLQNSLKKTFLRSLKPASLSGW